MGTHNSLLERFDLAEYRLCRSLNRGVAYPLVRRFFRYASRLGDGVIWYVLMVALPLGYGARGLQLSRAMLATGAARLLAYKVLKRTLARERPLIRHTGISLAH